MIPHQQRQHLPRQQIIQKEQQSNIQLTGTQPNIQFPSRQLQDPKVLSPSADPQPQQPIFTAGQDQSRRSQLSMLRMQQHQQLSGAGSDMLRMQRNPNALQSVKREFASPQGPQQAPHLLQLHQQQHLQKANDKGFSGLLPQNGTIHQQNQLRQSDRVPPKEASGLNDSTPPNQGAGFTDWRDEAYLKYESLKNLYAGDMATMFKKIRAFWCQFPEAHGRLGHMKNFVETYINFLRHSRADFNGFSEDEVHILFQRLEYMKSVILRYKGSASRHHNQHPQPPGSQPQLLGPEQQMNMKVPRCDAAGSPRNPTPHLLTSTQTNKINAGHVSSVASPELNFGSRSIDRQTRVQAVQSQHLNQPIHPTFFDMKKQPMSAQKMYDVNGSKLGQVAQSNPRIPQQHHSVGQVRELAYLNANSPKTSLQSSSQVRQGNLMSHLSKAGTAMQTVASDPNASSALSPFSASSLSLNGLKGSSPISPLSAAGRANHPQGLAKDGQIISQTTNKDRTSSAGSPKTLATALMAEASLPEESQTGISNVSSLQRLFDVVKSVSNEALCATVQDISSIMNTIDTIGGATVNCESRTFAYYPKNLLRGNNFNSLDGKSFTRRMKRNFGVFSAPADVTSSDGLHELSSRTSYLESTAACRTALPNVQLNTSLLVAEIKEINKRLVETALELDLDSSKNDSDTGFGEGTIIRCSYSPVGLGRNIELQSSGSRVLPLFCAQLLVPSDYPTSSPILLNDSFSSLSEATEESDLSKKVNTRFSSSLRELPQPPSLKEMARKWDDCARSVLTEFAASTGGGSFSTKFGKWEKCI